MWSLSYPGVRASPSTCRVLTIDWHVRGLYRCFGMHVVCASARVLSLPGGLLPWSMLFWVLFNQQTNKQTNKQTYNLVKWTKLISADFSFKFSAFYYASPRGLLLSGFFFEKSHQMFVSNISWIKIAEGELRIYSTAPRNENLETRVARNSSENRDLIPEKIWSCDRHYECRHIYHMYVIICIYLRGSPIEIRRVFVLQSGQGGGRSESKPQPGTKSDSMGTKLVPLRFLSSKTMKIPPQKSPDTRKSWSVEFECFWVSSKFRRKRWFDQKLLHMKE